MTVSVKKILLINPFKFNGCRPNIGMDPVVFRHVGQEIKTGVTFPIGLAYMAATLLEAGFEVKLLDPIAGGVSIKKIYSESKWADAIVMPFSILHAEDTARYRKDFKDKFFVLGGGLSFSIADWLFQKDTCDVVLAGEPEYTIVELMKNYPDYQNVAGIIYNNKGKVTETATRPVLENLDELPFPARHLADNKKYWEIAFWGRPTAWILPTRGCPYDCIFCSQNESSGRRVRYRSAGNIADEIEDVVRSQNIKNFVFFDETFNFNSRFVTDVCNEILRRGLKIKWWCAARADRVTAETVRLMKKSGCIELRFGLESANDEILKFMEKGETVAQIKKGIDITRKEGMNFSLQCIFGSPMESEETIKNTINFIKEARPMFVSFNILTPLPGSRLYRQLKEKPKPEEMASFDILHTSYPLGRYSGEELKKIVKKAYIGYYLSPNFIIRMAQQILKNPRLIVSAIKMLMKQTLYIYSSVLKRKEI
jgi:anaerobic magnesium-protoporphyrin IX monomethyl ester cyclase